MRKIFQSFLFLILLFGICVVSDAQVPGAGSGDWRDRPQQAIAPSEQPRQKTPEEIKAEAKAVRLEVEEHQKKIRQNQTETLLLMLLKSYAQASESYEKVNGEYPAEFLDLLRKHPPYLANVGWLCDQEYIDYVIECDNSVAGYEYRAVPIEPLTDKLTIIIKTGEEIIKE